MTAIEHVKPHQNIDTDAWEKYLVAPLSGGYNYIRDFIGDGCIVSGLHKSDWAKNLLVNFTGDIDNPLCEFYIRRELYELPIERPERTLETRQQDLVDEERRRSQYEKRGLDFYQIPNSSLEIQMFPMRVAENGCHVMCEKSLAEYYDISVMRRYGGWTGTIEEIEEIEGKTYEEASEIFAQLELHYPSADLEAC